MRSPLFLLCAFMSLAIAAEVHMSGNRAPTSQFATHGVASQLPCRDQAIHTQDRVRARQAALSQMLGHSAKASIVETASVNVKAFANGGMSFLFGLASSSNDVLDYINNGTTVFSRSVTGEEGSAASGRKHVAYTSIALVLVMLFFAVWM
ncbi:hypothetical protein FPOAC2_01649 [Fusarium poae]|uniref:Uncharacterized protein n=1 Tax=Fusarium poae TaxID=36050 RepID=A0A1B8B4C6_FUSPO|nr:hypothetical protein FPOAC1_001566 [Fusarium poae]KAG8675585.1 hypothetical protein FPOAC1_001566 [Fusarium poae]OBS27559.1 hypothetical protein FPOA_01501 [Fusarium poae]